MPTLNEREIHTVAEFAEFVEGQAGVRWYRGSGLGTHTLVPSLYRHPTN
jgi:hypothetical protein